MSPCPYASGGAVRNRVVFEINRSAGPSHDPPEPVNMHFQDRLVGETEQGMDRSQVTGSQA